MIKDMTPTNSSKQANGDTRMSEQQILNELSSIVYQQVFGYPRHELIQQAKRIAGDDWGFIDHGGDVDEQMRDWMCNEALEALSNAESEIAHALRALGRRTSLRHAKQLHKKIASKHAVNNIWQDTD